MWVNYIKENTEKNPNTEINKKLKAEQTPKKGKITKSLPKKEKVVKEKTKTKKNAKVNNKTKATKTPKKVNPAKKI
jgi:hypothetical protein